MSRISMLAILLCIAMPQASAEIYKWVDDKGNIHFSDSRPKTHAAERVVVKPNTYNSVSVEPFDTTTNKATAGKARVVMYSTEWCGVCKSAKRYMQTNNIPFKEYDVEKSRKGKADFARLNGSGVPILLIGDKRMNGFSPGRFEKMYQAMR